MVGIGVWGHEDQAHGILMRRKTRRSFTTYMMLAWYASGCLALLKCLSCVGRLFDEFPPRRYRLGQVSVLGSIHCQYSGLNKRYPRVEKNDEMTAVGCRLPREHIALGSI